MTALVSLCFSAVSIVLVVWLWRRVRALEGREHTRDLAVEYANIQLHNLNREQYDAAQRAGWQERGRAMEADARGGRRLTPMDGGR